MINLTALKGNLHTWSAGQVSAGVEVVFADQNAPAPGETYVTLKVGAIQRVGEGITEPVDPVTGQAVTRGIREITVKLQAIGAGAFDQLERIVSSLENPLTLMDLQAANIAYVDQLSDIMDLTGIIGSVREERAAVDLKFRIPSPYESADTGAAVGVIERVGITIENTGDLIVVNPPLAE